MEDGLTLSGILDSGVERPVEFWVPAIIEAARAAGRKAEIETGDALFELRQVERATQAALRALVEHGLAAGMTWQEIGAALGTSRQAAHERYGALPSPASRRGASSSRRGGASAVGRGEGLSERGGENGAR